MSVSPRPAYGHIRRGPMAADAFTQIRNALFRDPRLSAKAKGIFGFISTHREGWGVTPDSISAAMTDGVSAVRTGLRELEEFGYLVRDQPRRPDGTMGPIEYYITDQPSSEPVIENRPPAPTCGDTETRWSEPVVDFPQAVEPQAADHPHKKTNSKKTSGKKTSPLPPVVEPAAAVVPPQVGRDAAPEDQATVFVDRLPYRGQVPNRSTRERLLTRTRDAFAAGWTAQALHRQLTGDTANAQSITGLYLHRLAQLPDARAAAVASAAEETYTPPAYRAQPAPNAVPPNQAIAAARAAARAQRDEQARSRDHTPYIPTP